MREISNAIQEIRKLLSESLTPEFFNSVKSACDAISQLLNDANVSEDIKGSLALLHKLLKKAEEDGLI